MKNIISSTIIATTILIACNDNTSSNSISAVKDSSTVSTLTATATDSNHTVSITTIVNIYLQLKNALTRDNAGDAATTAIALKATFVNFDTTVLTAVQKKTFADIADDAKEHAEHIAKNGRSIANQREPF